MYLQHGQLNAGFELFGHGHVYLATLSPTVFMTEGHRGSCYKFNIVGIQSATCPDRRRENRRSRGEEENKGMICRRSGWEEEEEVKG